MNLFLQKPEPADAAVEFVVIGSVQRFVMSLVAQEIFGVMQQKNIDGFKLKPLARK
jgi:hypothetical protein